MHYLWSISMNAINEIITLLFLTRIFVSFLFHHNKSIPTGKRSFTLSSRISLFEEQNNREKDPILLKIQSISLDLGTINLKMSPFFLSQTQTVLFVSFFFLCFLCLSVSYSFNKKANVCSNSSPWTS